MLFSQLERIFRGYKLLTVPALGLACLAFLATSAQATILYTQAELKSVKKGNFDSGAQIWKLDGVGSTPTRVAEGEDPVISPDGKRAFFKRVDDVGSEDERLIDLTTGVVSKLPSGVWSSLPVAWLPDSQRILLVKVRSSRDSFWEALVELNVVTGAQTVLYSEKTTEELSNLSISPDGTQVVFSRQRYVPSAKTLKESYGEDVIKLDLATRAVTTLIHDTQDHSFDEIVWGPTKIAFGRAQLYKSSDKRTHQIWTINPDGSQMTRVPLKVKRESNGYLPIAWTPDGAKLVTNYYTTTDLSRIYLVDVATGAKKDLLPSVNGYSQAQGISKDGSKVLLSTIKLDSEFKKLIRALDKCSLYDDEDSSKQECPQSLVKKFFNHYFGASVVGTVPIDGSGALTTIATGAFLASWNE